MVKHAESEGFSFDRYTGTGHYRMVHKNGGTLVIPSTPSGPRWKKNVLADIRRISQGRGEHP